MPSTRKLLVACLLGLVAMALFAFTLVGLAGEAVAALALVGPTLRGACAAIARVRGVPRC
jgi:hypothetical protein